MFDGNTAVKIDPKWLPASIAELIHFRRTIKLTRGEKKRWRKPRPIRPSIWCEKHRVVTKSSIPGKWRNSTTAYLAGIMDASFFKSVETIVICAAPQVGKSEIVNNCIGYASDRRPGDVLYIYPDELTAKENSKDRILPMFRSSRLLRSFLTGAVDDEAMFRINLRHLVIYLGWARSAARLANKPLPYVVFDEIDKYPETAGKKEASPIALGEKRTRIFRAMRKIWKLSSPTIEKGPIWVALTKDAGVIFIFHVTCPGCGTDQQMEFDQIKWPEGVRDPELVKEKDLARYECKACKCLWDDEMRDDAVRAGQWRSKDKDLAIETYLKSFKPKTIGFHIPSWLSTFVGLSEVSAAFLESLKDKTAMKDFMNSHKAEPWVEYVKDRKEDILMKLADDRPAGIVPGGGIIAGITAGVDTQDNGFYYSIRAWGYGKEKESWGIRQGFIPTFGALRKVLWEDDTRMWTATAISSTSRLLTPRGTGHPRSMSFVVKIAA